MSVFIKNYNQKLRNAQPTKIKSHVIKPPRGSGAAAKIIPEIVIPPINTNIDFSTLKQYNIKQHPRVASMDITTIPENFDWVRPSPSDSLEIRKKKALINKPPNQALCGSCWAVAGSTAIADNFVVSGVVNWLPDLSSTWCLACYPQGRCQGGNPAELLYNVQQGGIATNHCIDYSWCSQNPACNGSALKHFNPQNTNLSALVPSCGCYFGGKTQHFLYKIDSSNSMSLNAQQVSPAKFAAIVKKQIYLKGSLVGGFLIYKNFMDGSFSNINGGVYLERGNYDIAKSTGQPLTFSDEQTSSYNYRGSHAVCIVGWGVAKNILIDNGGKRANVPYWYVRNSWGSVWGEQGCFKMAQYPYNQYSQFDKVVTIQTDLGQMYRGGGMIAINVSKPPVMKSLKQLDQIMLKNKRTYNDAYYKTEPKIFSTSLSNENSSFSGGNPFINAFLAVLIAIMLFIVYRVHTFKN
jgi:hypothetical protein